MRRIQLRLFDSLAIWTEELIMKNKMGFILPLLALFAASTALAEQPGDYRFPRECTMTPGGLPVPLCGKRLTKTLVVVGKEGASLKTYPAYFVPEQEELAPNKMRVIACGAGMAH